ncbi:MAG: hypothetical protein OK454_05430, partial [Thaumarchaeota archaeon]|nr:hypothetical protein [Nitrososphaerota archaeon]
MYTVTWSSPSSQSSSYAVGQATGAIRYIRRRTGFDMKPPMARPYRTHIDWGRISPKMTLIRTSATWTGDGKKRGLGAAGTHRSRRYCSPRRRRRRPG